MNERERIGKLIAGFRKEAGISQEKLSELSGVGYSHIARIELGRYSVGIDTLEKIANVFGKQIDFNDIPDIQKHLDNNTKLAELINKDPKIAEDIAKRLKG